MTRKEQLTIIGVVLGVFLVVAGIVWLFTPKTTFAKVEDLSWYYTVQLEQKTIRPAEQWGKPWSQEVVAGSMSCTRKFYGMERCHCRTERTTTGFGENRRTTTRQKCSTCPEYRNWCSYKYVDWPVVKTWTSAGKTFTTEWPKHPDPVVPDQRTRKDQNYNVIFTTKDGEKYTLHPRSIGEFKKYPRGGTWIIKVFLNNNIEIVDEKE